MASTHPHSAAPARSNRSNKKRSRKAAERRKDHRAVERAARTEAIIQSKARERQRAWAERGLPDLTAALTHKLSDLYNEVNADRAEADRRKERTEAQRQGWSR